MHWCFATDLYNLRKPGLTICKTSSAASSVCRRLPRFEAYVTVQHVKGVRFLGAKSTLFLQKHPGILRKGPRLDNNKKTIFATVRVRHRRLALLIKLFFFFLHFLPFLDPSFLIFGRTHLKLLASTPFAILSKVFFIHPLYIIQPPRAPRTAVFNFLPRHHPKPSLFPCCLANLSV